LYAIEQFSIHQSEVNDIDGRKNCCPASFM